MHYKAPQFPMLPILLPVLLPLLALVNIYDASQTFKSAIIHLHTTHSLNAGNAILVLIACVKQALQCPDAFLESAPVPAEEEKPVAFQQGMVDEPVTAEQDVVGPESSPVAEDDSLLESDDESDEDYEGKSESEYDPYEYDSEYESEPDDEEEEEESEIEPAEDPSGLPTSSWPSVCKPVPVITDIPNDKLEESPEICSSEVESSEETSNMPPTSISYENTPPTSPEPVSEDEKPRSRTESTVSTLPKEPVTFGRPILESTDQFTFRVKNPNAQEASKAKSVTQLLESTFLAPPETSKSRPIAAPTGQFTFSCETFPSPDGFRSSKKGGFTFPFQADMPPTPSEAAAEEKRLKNKRRADQRKAAKLKRAPALGEEMDTVNGEKGEEEADTTVDPEKEQKAAAKKEKERQRKKDQKKRKATAKAAQSILV